MCMLPSSQTLVTGELITITPISSFDMISVRCPGFNETCQVYPMANEIVTFMQTIRSFFYPSNNGKWTAYLGVFIRSFFDEISHHLSRNYTTESFSISHESIWKSFHAPTAKFLIGSSIGIFFESLYGKSISLQQNALSCMRNLFALDATYGKIFMDFFLVTLDPSSVTQSHQATTTLQILAHALPDFLYPRPIVIAYLPQFMQLLLPGLDPSDQNKTVLSLKFFATVFNWVPIRSRYASASSEGQHQHAYQLLHESGSSAGNPDYSQDYDRLGDHWNDWMLLFWDKIEGLLNSIEEKTTGNKNASNMMTNCIAECVGNFFRALSLDLPTTSSGPDSIIRSDIIEKFESYMLKTSNYPSAKTLGKIVRVFITMREGLFESTVKSLYDREVASLGYSHEKLAYRFLLIAACCRNATSDRIVSCMDSIFLPIINDENIRYHTNKHVKKAYLKLIKNLFRGLTATYIKTIQLSAEANLAFGSPNLIKPDLLQWHEPQVNHIGNVKELLAKTLHSSMKAIDSLLVNENSLSSKKREEQLFINMKIMEKVLRGSAELFLDDWEVSASDVSTSILSSRKLFIKKLSEADRVYIVSIRKQVLDFLMSSFPKLFCQSDNFVASASIYKIWMKIYRILVLNRMSTVQNIENMVKGMDYGIKQLYPSFILDVQKYLTVDHYHHANKYQSSSTSIAFWFGHHLPMTYIAQKANLQYILHLYHYGISSFRTILTISDDTDGGMARLFMDGLRNVVKFSCHYYDNVRSVALTNFDKLSGRFGGKLNPIVSELLDMSRAQDYQSLMIYQQKDSGNIEYSILTGICCILRQNRTFTRILTNTEELYPRLMQYFFLGPTLSSSIKDVDKQNAFEKNYYELFLKYIKSYSLSPTTIMSEEVRNGIFLQCYEIIANESNVLSKQSLIYASILYHFVGVVSLSEAQLTSIFVKLLDFIVNYQNQSIQVVSINMLVKLVTLSSSSLVSFSLDKLTSISWEAFLHGFALAHIRSADNGNNAFIEEILELTFRMSNFISRRSYPEDYEDKYGGEIKFQRRYSIFFEQLFTAYINHLLSKTNGAETKDVVSFVADLLAYSKKLPHSNEQELRANNCLRSEIFSSLYNALYSSLNKLHSSLWETIQSSLIDYMNEYVGGSSTSFAYEWCEAIYFIFLRAPISYTRPDAYEIVDARRSLIVVLYEQFQAALSAMVSGESDGFAKIQKPLLLMRAMLASDLFSIDRHPEKAVSRQPTSLLVYKIYRDLLQLSDKNPSKLTIGSSFQPIRAEIGTLIGILSSSIIAFGVEEELPPSKLIEKISINWSNEISSDDFKYSAEIGVIALKYYLINVVNPSSAAHSVIVSSLFKLSVEASSFTNDLEFSKRGTMMTSMAVSSLNPLARMLGATGLKASDAFSSFLMLIQQFSTHESFTVRRNICMVMMYYLSLYSTIFTTEEKTLWKNIMMSFIHDQHPKVQELAILGMSGYLQEKTSSSMSSIAATYTKNLEILYQRSKKKSNFVSPSSETTHWDTISMAISLIRAYPYDMPSWIPALISAVIKHIPFVQDKMIITKGIQDFKRSHQVDRHTCSYPSIAMCLHRATFFRITGVSSQLPLRMSNSMTYKVLVHSTISHNTHCYASFRRIV
jgi:hypothetical protein